MIHENITTIENYKKQIEEYKEILKNYPNINKLSDKFEELSNKFDESLVTIQELVNDQIVNDTIEKIKSFIINENITDELYVLIQQISDRINNIFNNNETQIILNNIKNIYENLKINKNEINQLCTKIEYYLHEIEEIQSKIN